MYLRCNLPVVHLASFQAFHRRLLHSVELFAQACLVLQTSTNSAWPVRAASSLASPCQCSLQALPSTLLTLSEPFHSLHFPMNLPHSHRRSICSFHLELYCQSLAHQVRSKADTLRLRLTSYFYHSNAHSYLLPVTSQTSLSHLTCSLASTAWTILRAN